MIYAIGDIHGEDGLLSCLYQNILENISITGDKDNLVVFLGDYTDRGAGSLKVFDFLRNLEDTPEVRHVFLRGNHEVMLVDALDCPKSSDVAFWLQYGGEAVLEEAQQDWEEFHQSTRAKVIRYWIMNHTKTYHTAGGYVFVHAGLDVRRGVEAQTPDVLLWARHMRKDHYKGYRDFVVHGHTPSAKPVVDENRICVDTSVGNRDKKMLTAVCLPNVRDDRVKPEFMHCWRPIHG